MRASETTTRIGHSGRVFQTAMPEQPISPEFTTRTMTAVAAAAAGDARRARRLRAGVLAGPASATVAAVYFGCRLGHFGSPQPRSSVCSTCCRRRRRGAASLPDRRRGLVACWQASVGPRRPWPRIHDVTFAHDRDLCGRHCRAVGAAAASRFRWGVLPMKRLTRPSSSTRVLACGDCHRSRPRRQRCCAAGPRRRAAGIARAHRAAIRRRAAVGRRRAQTEVSPRRRPADRDLRHDCDQRRARSAAASCASGSARMRTRSCGCLTSIAKTLRELFGPVAAEREIASGEGGAARTRDASERATPPMTGRRPGGIAVPAGIGCGCLAMSS